MSLPDLLTLLRLGLVPVAMLLAWRNQAHLYFWVLLVALATDMVDGFLARRLGIASERGARLDTCADLTLFLTTPVCLSRLFPAVLWAHRYLLGGLLGIYLMADLIGYAKFRRLPSYHTRGAKLSAILLGATTLGLFWLPRVEWLLYPASVVAVISYIEEIAITLTLPRWGANVPSWQAARRLALPHASSGSGRLEHAEGLALVTLVALSYAVAAVGALHVLRPDSDPLRRAMSNYIVGSYGTLMTSAFFALALALGGLALGLSRVIAPSWQSSSGLFLLGLAAIGFGIAGTVPKEVRDHILPATLPGYVHFLSGGVALVGLVAAIVLLSVSFQEDERWRPFCRQSLVLSVVNVAMLLVGGTLALVGWNGLGQRLIFGACLCWLVPVTWSLRALAHQGAHDKGLGL